MPFVLLRKKSPSTAAIPRMMWCWRVTGSALPISVKRIYVDDPYTGEHRITTKQDVADSALLADYLTTWMFMKERLEPWTNPLRRLNIHNAHAILANTTKHCFLGAGDRHNVPKIVEMAAAIAGEKRN